MAENAKGLGLENFGGGNVLGWTRTDVESRWWYHCRGKDGIDDVVNCWFTSVC